MPKPLPAGAMIIVGVTLVIGALVFWGFSEITTGLESARLPQSLAGLPLATVTYGSEAVQAISNLHGKDFQLKYGAMGDYGTDRQATLWVAGFADRTTAVQTVFQMHEKIAQGNSPFMPTDEKLIGERTVYVLDGMGQTHFYFQSGSQVIWLAANSDLSESALQQTLRFYP